MSLLSPEDAYAYLFLTSNIISISLSLSDNWMCDSDKSMILLMFSIFSLLSTCNAVCFELALYCDNERNVLENDTLSRLYSLSYKSSVNWQFTILLLLIILILSTSILVWSLII